MSGMEEGEEEEGEGGVGGGTMEGGGKGITIPHTLITNGVTAAPHF